MVVKRLYRRRSDNKKMGQGGRSNVRKKGRERPLMLGSRKRPGKGR